MVAGLEPAALAFAAGAVLVGGVVRGYTGFGSSMVWVTSLTLVMPPAAVVPVILAMEVLASLHLLPQAWRAVDWRSVGPLVAAACLSTPLGVWLLAVTPARPMQVAISVVVVVTAIVLWRGYALRRAPGMAATIGAGVVSGVLTGSTSAGGPPVVIFYFATPAGVDVARASLIAFFMLTDGVGVAIAAASGLFTWQSALRVALFLPPMLVGTALGSRRFVRADPEAFRRAVLLLLVLLGAAGLVRALV
ncbi:MAG: sulfite exporter TauE/SafE family protein [Candidatus Rokubacteria bacterium]|nr:sulfite exporter TauE/SafE family protein [Candidatus Rokubacteria bacterium]